MLNNTSKQNIFTRELIILKLYRLIGMMHLFDLPKEILIEILEYISYEEVSKARLVCRYFDQICQQVLNCGFNKAIKRHNIGYKRIKALLPRRESERRNHILARHADILTSVETRLSMLSMTYGKYIDLHLCCFIPGRVLDEIFRILRLVTAIQKSLRPHEILQELRDISSMAIEHFDDRIVHTLKKSVVDGLASYNTNGSTCNGNSVRNILTTSGLGSITFSTMGDSISPVGRNTNIEHKQVQPLNNDEHRACPDARSIMAFFKKLETDYKRGLVNIHRIQQVQALQSKRLQRAMTTMAEQKTEIIELRKRLEDVDAKNREICDNLKHIKTGGVISNEPADVHLKECNKLPTVSKSCSNINIEHEAMISLLPTISDNTLPVKRRAKNEDDNINTIVGNTAKKKKYLDVSKI